MIAKKFIQKRTIIIAAVLTAVVALPAAYFLHYKPLWAAMDAVRSELRDPDSAKFYKVRRVENGILIFYCGEVNAKTLVGGYGGKRRFAYHVENDEVIFIPNERPSLEADEVYYSTVWRGACQKNAFKNAQLQSKMWFSFYETAKNSTDEREIQGAQERADALRKQLTIY